MSLSALPLTRASRKPRPAVGTAMWSGQTQTATRAR